MSPSGSILITSLLISARYAVAFTTAPSLVGGDFTTWAPPGPGDVRSPCPALNALANHGFIPHNGKGMSLDIVIQGLSAGLNIDAPLATFFHTGALLASPTALEGTFDLKDVDQHNFPIEHDASLSRGDAFFGDDHSINQTLFNQVLSFYTGLQNTTLATSAAAKYARLQDSKKCNPTFTYGPREFILSYGETALYLSVMGDPKSGIAPVDYVKIFFQQERLPYAEGWRRPTQPTTFESLTTLINKLYLNSPEPLPEGLEVLSVGAYKDVLGLASFTKSVLGPGPSHTLHKGFSTPDVCSTN